MAPPEDNDDRKAKDVLEGELDPATRAELERWFGLPSYQELEDRGQEDPELAAARERRDAAIAAVDPAMLEAHRRRTDPPDNLLKFTAVIEVHVDPSIALLDMGMIERQASLAEPREVEIPEQLRDDLRECTPQAILRDLHRPETDFEKVFEIVDLAGEQRFDIVAEIATVMSTSWKLPPEALGQTPAVEGRALIKQLRAEQRQSWPALFSAQPLPNRRWTPENDR